MTSIDVGGARLHWIERGQGEPVVLVHGSNSDHRTWDGALDALSERYRVIAYSRRYHWPNETIPDDADYSMPEHVEDLRALLDAMDLDSAHLVGHSYGAYLCLLLAIRHPKRVRSLVLSEPPILRLFTSDPPRPGEVLKLLRTRPRTALAIVKFGAFGVGPATAAMRRGDLDEALRIVGTAVLGRDSFQRLSPARHEQARLNFFKAELLGSGFAPLDPDDVSAVGCRVLLLTGERSPRLFHRFTDHLEELLPRAERREIPAASHMLHEDNAALYSQAVLSFLAGHAEGRSEASSVDPSSRESAPPC